MAVGGTALITRPSIKSFMEVQGLISTPEIGNYQVNTAALTQIKYFCNKLVNEGILMSMGNQSNDPLLGENFICYGFDSKLAEYGGYDYLVLGFIHIQKVFTNSILPVDIRDSKGDPDIGTSFIIDDNLLVTAKHCIEDKNQISIRVNDTEIIPESIFVFEDERIDICIVKTVGKPFEKIKRLFMNSPNVLMEVLTMGYPPIPGFDAIQISDIANIGAESKSSKGNIIGIDKSYLDGLEYFLINAKVKSGNSGSPVIDNCGRVVGIVTNIPLDPTDKEKLDSLGYGIALSSKFIISLLSKTPSNSEIKQIGFKVLENGKFSTQN